MSEPAKHLTRLPQELYAEVQKAAEDQGVSANTFIVAVLAGALGYRLPEGSTVLLALTEKEAWAYWHAASNSEDDLDDLFGRDADGETQAKAFLRAHSKMRKALPKK